MGMLKRASFVISEPWDFVSRHGGGPFEARLLERPVIKGPSFTDFIALIDVAVDGATGGSAYFAGRVNRPFEFSSGNKTIVALTLIPESKALSQQALENIDYGGLNLLADMTVL